MISLGIRQTSKPIFRPTWYKNDETIEEGDKAPRYRKNCHSLKPYWGGK